MATKLITSLDELEPGMKTKDGWRFVCFRGQDFGDYFAVLTATRGPRVTRYISKETTDSIFLNQKVEVSE